MYLIIFSLTHFQQYLEIYGPGGSGKSTLQNLFSAQVGKNFTYTTDINSLENNKFETANLLNKKQVIVTDSPSYRGSLSVLKAITGEDNIRFEEKGKQAGTGFVCKALIAIASNEIIAPKDYTSGISRRRISIHFDQVPLQKDRIFQLEILNNGELIGLLGPEISTQVNMIISIPKEEVEEAMRNREARFPSITAINKLVQESVNPIQSFIMEYIKPADHLITVNIPTMGYYSNDPDLAVNHQYKDSEDFYIYPQTWEPSDKFYLNSFYDMKDLFTLYNESLLTGLLPFNSFKKRELNVHTFETIRNQTNILAIYPMYCFHCFRSGCKPVSLNQFTNLFIDQIQTIYNIKLDRQRDRRGIYFTGIIPAKFIFFTLDRLRLPHHVREVLEEPLD